MALQQPSRCKKFSLNFLIASGDVMLQVRRTNGD